jgi:hypothetical protein
MSSDEEIPKVNDKVLEFRFGEGLKIILKPKENN